MTKEGTVYLICDLVQEYYKIGRTSGKIENRMKQLQTGSPNQLHLVKEYKTNYPSFIETALHKEFADKRINNEWFDLTNEDVKNFEFLCKTKQDIAEVLEDNHFGKKYLK